jgi:hypothetical protein
VRGVALFLGWLIASCAPDYGHSAFLCDEQHGCPDGQTCITGRCRRSDPIGNGSGDGVKCGGMQCDRTQQCCVDGFETWRCIPAQDACLGTSALCDGMEDCGMHDLCCADGDNVTCDATCEHYACREREDCPATAPNCCDATDLQWGKCSQSGC